MTLSYDQDRARLYLSEAAARSGVRHVENPFQLVVDENASDREFISHAKAQIRERAEALGSQLGDVPIEGFIAQLALCAADLAAFAALADERLDDAIEDDDHLEALRAAPRVASFTAARAHASATLALESLGYPRRVIRDSKNDGA